MSDDTGPTSVELLRMGELGLEQGYRQEAEAYFDAVLRRAPGHPQALLGKARACRDSQQALDLVEAVLRQQPDARAALELRADLLSQSIAEPLSSVASRQPSARARLVARAGAWLRRTWLALALSGAVLGITIGMSLRSVSPGQQQPNVTPPQVLTGAEAEPGLLSAAPRKTSTVGDAPLALALLLVVDRSQSYQSRGSGSVITEDGLVLTNYHVVANAERTSLANPDGLALVGLTLDAHEAPTEWFIGAVVAQDSVRDLAVLRLLYSADGRALRGRSYTRLPWGDSDDLALGQTLVGLGYPAIGGNTLTLVRGSMAGFASDEYGVRYGKTDSELAPGSSGGAVLDEAGLLVGVMTSVTRDDVTQGRLGYFVLMNDARVLITEAQRAPLPQPDTGWLVAFARALMRPAQ